MANDKSISKPIQLIDDDERLTLEVGESKIYYRRIMAAERNNIVLKHTKRGTITPDNQTKIAEEILTLCVLDWKNVISKGKQIKYSPELLMKLPESVLQLLETGIIFNTAGEQDTTGN